MPCTGHFDVYLPTDASLDTQEFGSNSLIPARFVRFAIAVCLLLGSGRARDRQRPRDAERADRIAGHLAKLEPRQSREIGFYKAVRVRPESFPARVEAFGIRQGRRRVRPRKPFDEFPVAGTSAVVDWGAPGDEAQRRTRSTTKTDGARVGSRGSRATSTSCAISRSRQDCPPAHHEELSEAPPGGLRLGPAFNRRCAPYVLHSPRRSVLPS